MLRPAPHIRYHIAAILAAHWIQFVLQYKRWIRPTRHGVLEYWNDGRMGLIGIFSFPSFIYQHSIIPTFQHSCFCPTCGKHATDVWANQVLNRFLNVPYHHLIMAIPWQLRIVVLMNRQAGLNLLVHAATEAIQQWARDVKGMRMGIRSLFTHLGPT